MRKPAPGINWNAILPEYKHGSHDQQSHAGGRGGGYSPALHSGGGRVSRFRENRSGPGGSIMDHPAHAKAVGEFEDKIKRDQAQEHAMVINSDGSVAVMSGEQYAVEIKVKGPGAHVTHNHPAPPNSPLSDMDIAVAKDANLRSMRAVSYDPDTDTTYEYEAQRPAKGWSERMVWDAMSMTDRWQKKYHPRLKAGETEEEVSKDAFPDLYEMQSKMFDKYGVAHSLKKYKGRRRKGLEPAFSAPVDLQGDDLESVVEQTFLIDDSSVMSFGDDVAGRTEERLRLRMMEHPEGKAPGADWPSFIAEKAKPKVPKQRVRRIIDAAVKPPKKPTRPEGANTGSGVGYYTSQEDLDRAIERALLASSPERMKKELDKLLKYYTPDEITERIREQFAKEVQGAAEEAVRGVAKKLGKEEVYNRLRKGLKDAIRVSKEFRRAQGANAQERAALQRASDLLHGKVPPRRLIDRGVRDLADQLEYSPFGWRFNAKEQRWEQQFPPKKISPEQTQLWLEKRMKNSQERMARYARDYANRNMSKEAFTRKMHKELIYIHTNARMLAVGGRANMTPADWGTMGRQLRKEFEWLVKFAEHKDDSSRLTRMNPQYAQRRARLYAGTNVKSTYFRGLTDSHKRAGFGFKRRYGPHDDGTCATCRSEISRGWVPISEPGWEIGHTECRIGDRCGIKYAKNEEQKAILDLLHKHGSHN